MDKVTNTAGFYTSNHNNLVIHFTKYLVVNTFKPLNKVYVNECDTAFEALKHISKCTTDSMPVKLSLNTNDEDVRSLDDGYHIFRVRNYETINSRGYDRITYEELWMDVKNQFSLLTDSFKQHERDRELFSAQFNKPFKSGGDFETLGDLLDDSEDAKSKFLNPPNRLD